MKSMFSGILCRILAVGMMALPWQAQAGMIGTDQAAPASAISRSDVTAQLERFGLSPEDAKERVAALSDAELADISGRIDALPAGGLTGALPVIAAIILIYYLMYLPSLKEQAAPATGKPKPAAPEKK
jgi:uncharacterized protein DUF6627